MTGQPQFAAAWLQKSAPVKAIEEGGRWISRAVDPLSGRQTLAYVKGSDLAWLDL